MFVVWWVEVIFLYIWLVILSSILNMDIYTVQLVTAYWSLSHQPVSLSRREENRRWILNTLVLHQSLQHCSLFVQHNAHCCFNSLTTSTLAPTQYPLSFSLRSVSSTKYLPREEMTSGPRLGLFTLFTSSHPHAVVPNHAAGSRHTEALPLGYWRRCLSAVRSS